MGKEINSIKEPESPALGVDREMTDILCRLGSRINEESIIEDAKRFAEAAKAELMKEAQAATPAETQPDATNRAPYPTDLCRVSPFFPLSKAELKNRPFLDSHPIASARFGSILYTGPKLSTYDEDALLALLSVLDGHVPDVTLFDADSDPRPTYTYRGPIRPILQAMGLKDGAKSDYDRLLHSLKLLAVAGLQLSIGASGQKTLMSSILANVFYDSKRRQLSVTVNPYFYEMYVSGNITFLNLARRAKLTSPVAKSLYRFISSQRSTYWFGNIETVIDILNLDPHQPLYRIRPLIKKAINELQEKKLATPKSCLDKADKVHIYKSSFDTGK